MLTASNTGQDALWQEAKKQGAISEDTTRRVWILTMDDRLCELCEPMEDAEAPLSGPFISPKTKQEHMRPPLHVQCRCSVGLRFVQRETVTQLLQRGFRETAEAVLKAVREPRTETVEKDVKRDASGLVTGLIERRTSKAG